MPTKLQLYTQMADHSAEWITQGRERWTSFLDTAARLYKYPFPEQLMIFAQRPDAKACAPLETWNDPMNRWIRRGSKGIALIDTTTDKPRLKYVFDVSDTEEGRRSSRRPFLWELREEHEAPVMEALANAFDSDVQGDLGNILYEIAGRLATEYYDDHQRDIEYSTEGSYLEDYDEFNIGVAYRDALTVSLAYSLMSRCGIDTGEYFEDEDFMPVFDFNTPDAVNALGTGISQLSEQVLREIEVTIKNYERQKTVERSATHGQLDISPVRGLSDTQPDIAGTAGRTDRQIRPHAPDVSERPPANIVQFPNAEREVIPPPAGNRQDSEQSDGATYDGIDNTDAAPGQGDQSNGMDSPHEQPETPSGRTDIDGADLQLEPFPTEQAQREAIAQAEEQPSSAFSISDEEIDAVLRDAIENPESRQRIISRFEENPRSREAAHIIKEEYSHLAFTMPRTDGEAGYIGLLGEDKGIAISKGNAATTPLSERAPAATISLPWPKVQQRITRMIEAGQFLTTAAQIQEQPASEPKAPRMYEKGDLVYMPDDTEMAVFNIQFSGEVVYLSPPEESQEVKRPWLIQQYSRTDFEQLLTQNPKNQHFTQFLTADISAQAPAVDFLTAELDGINPDLRDVLENSLLTGEHKVNIRQSIDAGATNGQLNNYFSNTFPNEAETMTMTSGETADYFTTPQGISIEVQDKYGSKLGFSWADVAPVVRTLSPEWVQETTREQAQTAPEREAAPAMREAPQPVQATPTEITQDDIDAAIIGWNGDPESKQRVYDYMCLHARERDTAAFLKAQYGGDLLMFTVAKKDAGPVMLPWPKVQRRIAQLIDLAEFLPPTAPQMQDVPEPEAQRGRMYDVGDTVYLDNKPYIITNLGENIRLLDAETQSPRLPVHIFIPRSNFYNRLTWDERNKPFTDYFADHINDIDADVRLVLSQLIGPDTQAAILQALDADADNYNLAHCLSEQFSPGSFGLEADGLFLADYTVLQNGIGFTLDGGDKFSLSWLDMAPMVRGLSVGWEPIPPEQAQSPERNQDAAPTAAPEAPPQGTPISPPPVFFVDWETAQHDFDLHHYNDRDVIGYNKDGVEYVVGKSGSITYITSTGAFWGSNTVPGNIYEQINSYRSGDLTDEQVRENYLKILSDFTEQQEKPAAETVLLPPPAATPEKSRQPEAPAAHTSQARVNFHITDEHLGEGGAKTKYGYNVAAIRTLKQIEAENRLATPDEQQILSKYVGWGGLPQAFDSENDKWTKEYTELQSLLAPDEYDLARASTLNAHYTSPTVIKAIYDAVECMGFKGGNILEPACGIGNFFGMLPESMVSSKLYGVELDSITGRIARQLYQKADIRITGFEKTGTPDALFDLAIGNVPFGNYKVPDKRYDKNNFAIHDYFFAKALDQVRPGGIVAFITSNGTLDKANSSVRKYIAQRAELLGAVRLPNDAFLKNAGTEVTTDIIFLQKRDRLMDIQPDWVHLGRTKDGVPVNSYFAEHPEMMLGTMAFDKSMYGDEKDTTCHPIPDADLTAQLQKAITDIQGEITEPELDDIGEQTDLSIPADPDVRNYSYTLVDGKVYFRENSRMHPADLPDTTLERVKGMVELRDCVHSLINYQLDEYGNAAISEKQAELNLLYDNFTAKYGLINTTANSRAFSSDSAYYLLCSLEILDENGELDRKADMFSKRTIKQKTVVTSVDTASEALAVSIAERACVDMGFMQSLTGFSEEKLIADLQGVIFRDLGNQLPADAQKAFDDLDKRPFVTVDEYLSGNVRQKLRLAKGLAEIQPDLAERIAPNIAALEQAQPKDLDASEISVRLGSTWVDKKYIEQFVHELLQPPSYLEDSIKVNYFDYTGEWNVTAHRRIPANNVLANVTYGTKRMNAYRIVEETLNLKDVRVYDEKEVDGKKVRELNKKETTLAQQKQEAIKQAFQDWIFKDPDRRRDLVQTYNERFNSSRPREYDGSHINFSGISPDITLRPHQLNAIAHILYGGNTLLAHEVGAGKTFEMVAAAMEAKRLGLAQKSLFAVPNHLTEQWASEFLRLYPSANILVATAKDFEMKNRKKFCAKIATGDYDAVIIGHSQLEKIPMSKERQERLLQEQIWEITQGIDELKRNDGERFSIKQLEKTKKSLEARLDRLNDESRKDDVVTFEQLGVDRLFVDEAHSFKNLFLYTKMRNVAGLSTSEAQKSSDLFMKCRYLDELTDGKGVIFATGTPISNSMTEMYTMQRYLQYETLKRNRLTHFDCWASTFGETTTAIELAPEGTGYRARTRFAKFHNLPELMCMFREVADIKTADMMNLPRPKANYHTTVVKPSELQKSMVKELSARAAIVHRGGVDPSEDNMLKITSDGRKIGLDQRLINPMLPDDEGSKVNACMSSVYEIWQDTKADKLTQLVFCDFSTPNTDGRFNVYDDIREKLLEKGIPADEIAFIHDANTEARKKELFSKVRQGKVRVLMGSTFKMGSGTNVQDRLIHLHDLDCPWRPSDLEQRAGRIVRQGNMNPEVGITRYVTEGTFDAYLYQTIENKQRFISQIMSSKSPVRSCEDVDETALSYAEIKALCAGNPLIKEKMDLDIEVARLRLLKADHQSQIYRLEDDLLTNFPRAIEQGKEQVTGFKNDQARIDAGTQPNKDGFSPMEIHGVIYTDKEKAGTALLEACKKITDATPVKIGTYRGLDMNLLFDTLHKTFRATLKGSMSYGTDLGTDVFGNITRLNNVIADLPQRLISVQKHLENTHQQVKNAEQERQKPFAFETELKDKEARLAFLDAELNMDTSHEEHGPEQISLDGFAAKDRAMSAKAKPSILESLKAATPSARPAPDNMPDKTKKTEISI